MNIFRRNPLSLGAAVALVAGAAMAASARADSIGYSMSGTIPTNSATQGIDITNGGNALDWMAFVGVNPAQASNQTYKASTMPVWDASPSGGVESITAPTAGSTWNQGGSGPFIQYSNGTDPFGDSGLAFNTSDYVWNWNTPGTTFSHTLLQANETLTLPVISYTGGSTSVGLQVVATLTNAAGTQTATLPATAIPLSEMDATDATHALGILTLNVAGSIGDTLSVSVGQPTGGNSGIFSVTVMPSATTPEPSACLLFGSAAICGILLTGQRRFRPLQLRGARQS